MPQDELVERVELRGSVSLRLYPHNELAAPAIVDELVGQAQLGRALGFDGIMVSEHHGGFSGYLPGPVQMVGWALQEMDGGWAGACPLLLPLRPVAQVAEEVAWLAARFPGRVILGVAPGSLVDDFEAFEVPHDQMMPRYRRQLAPLVALLSGRGAELDERAYEVAATDRAILHCAEHPVPVLGAAMSDPAAARAARCGAGLLFDSMSAPEHLRTVADAYRAAGGTGPVVLNRRVWVGSPPRDEMDAQFDVYRSYTTSKAQSSWGGDQLVTADDGAGLADRLIGLLDTSSAEGVNLRVHAAGVTPAAAREQIEALARDVVPALRTWLGTGQTA
jgi:alkanesulfonate monooxygenase SsuD/methylene tetrahydromethanopterin reductase-like flavin-dependent oxidoreductase (luciferase family)